LVRRREADQRRKGAKRLVTSAVNRASALPVH
jgi:hypothetical protein